MTRQGGIPDGREDGEAAGEGRGRRSFLRYLFPGFHERDLGPSGESPPAEIYGRRELLRRLGRYAGFLAATNLAAAGYEHWVSTRGMTEGDAQEQDVTAPVTGKDNPHQGREIPTEEPPVGVITFADEILMRARDLNRPPVYANIYGLFNAGYLGALGYDLTKRHFGKRGNGTREMRTLSTGAFAVNRFVDFSSTADTLRVMGDPRFTEYGFNIFVVEGSPTNDHNPASPSTIFCRRSIIPNLAGLAASYYAPLLGIGLFPTTPVIYSINESTGRMLRTAYRIGDGVGEMLQDGLSPDIIRAYISSYGSGGSAAGIIDSMSREIDRMPHRYGPTFSRHHPEDMTSCYI